MSSAGESAPSRGSVAGQLAGLVRQVEDSLFTAHRHRMANGPSSATKPRTAWQDY